MCTLHDGIFDDNMRVFKIFQPVFTERKADGRVRTKSFQGRGKRISISQVGNRKARSRFCTKAGCRAAPAVHAEAHDGYRFALKKCARLLHDAADCSRATRDNTRDACGARGTVSLYFLLLFYYPRALSAYG